MQFFWGVFLCDVQNHPVANDFIISRPRTSKMLAIVFLVFGCFVASYPEGHAEWQPWSQWLFNLLVLITPKDPDFPRFGSGLGLELITLGIHFSPFLKDALSSKYLLWLGKQSFAVYLLHGPLLRWLLCWMVYGVHLPEDVLNEQGETVPGKLIYPGNYKLMIWLPIWLPLNYAVAMMWTTYVDPWCAQVTEQMVSHLKATDDEKQGGVLLPH
jgi:peptidoglycan/LPS O-acetylase OafA/YrhL